MFPFLHHKNFLNNCQQVLTALPAIDFGPPTERRHVTCKLKKLQWEGERRNKIEEDNFKLLQRMGSIMRRNRLENHWETPPPDFLHRVGIYHRTRSPTPYRELEDSPENAPGLVRRRGCSACTPSPMKPPTIPEERIPWSPPRERLSRRRSSSVVMQPLSDFDIIKKKTEQKKIGDAVLPGIAKNRSKSVSAKKLQSEPVSLNRIVLTQGALKVSVNFPADAEVKIISGNKNCK